MPLEDAQHLGRVRGGERGSSAGPLINVQAWEGMSGEELVGLARQLSPRGQLAEVVGYAGPDLVEASVLGEAELAELYVAPRREFVAGLGFGNQAFWRELAKGNAEVLRWVEEGYSEFIPCYTELQRVDLPNNKNTAEHRAFVSGEVGSWLM